METEASNSSSDTSLATTTEEGEDLASQLWWDSLATILKSCFTTTRVDLEVSNIESENIRAWIETSTADLLSSGDGTCREQILRFLAEDVTGIKSLLNCMIKEPEGEIKLGKRRETISKILREAVNPRSGNGKVRSAIIKQVIAADYLPASIVILKDLMHLRHKVKSPDDTETLDTILIHFLWFLSAVSTNDSSFALKVRDMLKVKFFHNEVYKKLFFAKSSSHYPLLKILRQLSRNEFTTVILGKEGVMNTIRKSFTVVGVSHSGKLLILMDMLTQLTKKKINCVKFQKAGLIVKMMQCFSNWELWRGKGLFRLSKFVISIYNHIARTSNGRKALVKCDAILQIRKFCESCPSEKCFDDIIMRCAGMIATCYQKDSIPLESLNCPILFQVPESGRFRKLQDNGSSSDDEGSDDNNELDSDSAEGGSNTDDNDDEASEQEPVSSDDELNIQGSDPKSITPNNLAFKKSIGAGDTLSQTTTKSEKFTNDTFDLAKYEKYFQEFDQVGQKVLNRNISNTLNPTSVSTTILLDDNLNETRKFRGVPKSEHKYPWMLEQKDCDYVYWTSMEELRKQFSVTANTVKHVAPFVKISYPEFVLAYSNKTSESTLPTSDRSVLRNKINMYISKIVGGDSFKPKVVYCLDNILKMKEKSLTTMSESSLPYQDLKNSDEKQIGKHNKKLGLLFEARFESGNLRKAIQIGEREYDLLITSDINSRHHNQWFYFQISNTVNDKSYTFNIINCTKSNSLFNYGMQPMVFSVAEALRGRTGWLRVGSDICYYKNGYKCSSKKRNCCNVYHTLSFNLTFIHKGDVVYIAYHVPYTYSRLMVELNAMITATESRDDVAFKYDTLCQTLNKNQVPVLTITSKIDDGTLNERKIIFLTSRVHPGESNASWVMKGILEFLLFGKTLARKYLLKKYVFKIVPMLNVEGVINGCHRCGLTSEDLNRCWKSPSENLHPTIFHTKMLIEYCCKNLKLPPILYCDLHGHSRRKNVFFYGCSFNKSWAVKDKLEVEDFSKLVGLPESMDKMSSAFCLAYCNYDVKKGRETTARVAVWRDYQILRSYTLECSYCGCDRGPYKGTAFGTYHLLEMGKDFCKACVDL